VRNTLLGLVIAGVSLVLVARFVASRTVVVDRPVPGGATENAASNVGTPPPGSASPDPAALADTESAAIYARTCSACHGMPGEPGTTLGTKLFEPTYGAARADSTIARIIAQGVPGTAMMGFGPGRGSLLSADQVDAMVRWIRATGSLAR